MKGTIEEVFQTVEQKDRRQEIQEKRQNHYRIDQEIPNCQFKGSLEKEHLKKIEDRKLWKKEKKISQIAV